MAQLRPVNLGNGNNNAKKMENHTRVIDPNKALVDYINSVAKQLDVYNHKVAKITHQEDKLK